MSIFERVIIPPKPDGSVKEPVYQREYEVVKQMIQDKTEEFDRGTPLIPFVMVVQNQCPDYPVEFVILFTIPERQNNELKYSFARIARLTPDAYLDWFLVAGDIVNAKYVSVCQ